MTARERVRLRVLHAVAARQISLVQAADQMGVSDRQARRLWSRFKQQGDAGLVHRLRGRPGNRRADPQLRQQALTLYREHYSDFGLTLACEYLRDRHGLTVDDSTLGRWLSQAKLWRPRRKRPPRHRRRERRACLGQLVQIDGSHHDWFEGRAGKCVLMVMIDDATNRTWAQFCPSEETLASMAIFRQWALRWGLPLALYPDRHSIYWQSGPEADEVANRTGKRPLTQFGRAMEELGLTCRPAHTPQAKGRVERCNGVLQDRLIKAMRVDGITGIEAGNAYLRDHFLPAFNARFEREAADASDAHQPADEAALDDALCLHERRVVGRDHCVSFEGQVLQLDPGRKLPGLAGKAVEVQRTLDGALRVKWQGHRVTHRPIPHRPRPVKAKPTALERVSAHQGPYKPPKGHPWRKAALAPTTAAC